MYAAATADIADGSPKTVSWVVDTAGPGFTLRRMGPPTYLPRDVSLRVRVDASEPLADTLVAADFAPVNATVAGVEALGDSAFVVTLDIDPVWPEPTGVELRFAPCAGTDAAGNCGSGQGQVLAWALDGTPPSVAIVGPREYNITDAAPFQVKPC